MERAYVDALGRVAGWRLDGEELVLLDEDDAEVLRYAAASPVGDWEVTAFLNGDAVSSPLPGTTLTATFGDDGTLSGSSGCNRYTTTYTTDQGAIEIAPPAGTKKLCPEPEGVMEQEAAYLAALPTAVAVPPRRRLARAAERRRDVRRRLRPPGAALAQASRRAISQSARTSAPTA